VQWQPSRENWQQRRPRGRRDVPPLSQLCCITVAEHIGSVESLRGLPQIYMARPCFYCKPCECRVQHVITRSCRPSSAAATTGHSFESAPLLSCWHQADASLKPRTVRSH
jgi:hypothetical protein